MTNSIRVNGVQDSVRGFFKTHPMLSPVLRSFLIIPFEAVKLHYLSIYTRRGEGKRRSRQTTYRVQSPQIRRLHSTSRCTCRPGTASSTFGRRVRAGASASRAVGKAITRTGRRTQLVELDRHLRSPDRAAFGLCLFLFDFRGSVVEVDVARIDPLPVVVGAWGRSPERALAPRRHPTAVGPSSSGSSSRRDRSFPAAGLRRVPIAVYQKVMLIVPRHRASSNWSSCTSSDTG